MNDAAELARERAAQRRRGGASNNRKSSASETNAERGAERIDWDGVTLEAARRLRGEEGKRQSDSIRFGTHGSLAVCVRGARRGAWYSYEDGVGGGPVDLVMHELGVDKRGALAWLETERLIPARQNTEAAERQTSEPDEPAEARRKERAERREAAKRKAAADAEAGAERKRRYATEILTKAESAMPSWARAWAFTFEGGAKAGVWRFGNEKPLPSSIRYLTRGAHDASRYANLFVCALAPIAEWIRAYPNAPCGVGAIHTIAVDDDGRKVLDRPDAAGGMHKRSLGGVEGRVFAAWTGNADWSNGVCIVEGVADALAVVSTLSDSGRPCIASVGGLKNLMRMTDAIAALGKASIYPDIDGAGLTGARRLSLAIQMAGGKATIEPIDGSDPAEAAIKKNEDDGLERLAIQHE